MFTLDVATHYNKISHKYILQDSSEIFGQYKNIRQVRVSSRVIKASRMWSGASKKSDQGEKHDVCWATP